MATSSTVITLTSLTSRAGTTPAESVPNSSASQQQPPPRKENPLDTTPSTTPLSDFKEDEHISCPYNRAHQILISRMQTHLTKCRENYPRGKKKVCPYNSMHLVERVEWPLHCDMCPDRTLNNGIQKTIETRTESLALVPVENREISSSEDWDTDDSPSYNPEVKLQDGNLLVQPKGKKQSDREAFRQERRRMYQQSMDNPHHALPPILECGTEPFEEEDWSSGAFKNTEPSKAKKVNGSYSADYSADYLKPPVEKKFGYCNVGPHFDTVKKDVSQQSLYHRGPPAPNIKQEPSRFDSADDRSSASSDVWVDEQHRKPTRLHQAKPSSTYGSASAMSMQEAYDKNTELDHISDVKLKLATHPTTQSFNMMNVTQETVLLRTPGMTLKQAQTSTKLLSNDLKPVDRKAFTVTNPAQNQTRNYVHIPATPDECGMEPFEPYASSTNSYQPLWEQASYPDYAGAASTANTFRPSYDSSEFYPKTTGAASANTFIEPLLKPENFKASPSKLDNIDFEESLKQKEGRATPSVMCRPPSACLKTAMDCPDQIEIPQTGHWQQEESNLDYEYKAPMVHKPIPLRKSNGRTDENFSAFRQAGTQNQEKIGTQENCGEKPRAPKALYVPPPLRTSAYYQEAGAAQGGRAAKARQQQPQQVAHESYKQPRQKEGLNMDVGTSKQPWQQGKKPTKIYQYQEETSRYNIPGTNDYKYQKYTGPCNIPGTNDCEFQEGTGHYHIPDTNDYEYQEETGPCNIPGTNDCEFQEGTGPCNTPGPRFGSVSERLLQYNRDMVGMGRGRRRQE